ncbi:MAG: YkgJ family cysteine cluster protein [Gammaproteobacteria bacterium]
MAQDDLDVIRDEIQVRSPVQPVRLRADSEFRFDCHRGVPCFNACCKNIDIALMPYDIARLKRRAGMTSAQWVGAHSVPYAMDGHDMPGLKLATKPGGAECVFLTKDGCGVYEDRPSACRYYALGSMGMRRAASAEVEEIYFVVKEAHCKGHDEPRTTSVAQYRKEQGLEQYDRMNREWRDIILKKRSSGPGVGKPSARSLQLFDMCSYDLDNFRDFLNSSGFNEVFDLPAEERAALSADEDALLLFACKFLKQVLFGEMSIARKADAREKRMARRGKKK